MISPRLADELARYEVTYLLTVGGEVRPHVSRVELLLDGGELLITGGASRHRGEPTSSIPVTVLCAPADPRDYSLIIDGSASARGADLLVTPTRAVRHRPASPATVPASGCQADCIELPLDR